GRSGVGAELGGTAADGSEKILGVAPRAKLASSKQRGCSKAGGELRGARRQTTCRGAERAAAAAAAGFAEVHWSCRGGHLTERKLFPTGELAAACVVIAGIAAPREALSIRNESDDN
ncbi:unnamed protein product, partial [Phaeothamnion confervicola]